VVEWYVTILVKLSLKNVCVWRDGVNAVQYNYMVVCDYWIDAVWYIYMVVCDRFSDDLREHLKSVSMKLMAQKQEQAAAAAVVQDSDSTSSDEDSSDNSSDDSSSSGQ